MYKTVSCFCLAVILILTNIGTGNAYYDPTVGRFITQDEYLGEPTTPPSLHRYLYAYSNPTAYVDPNGREPISTSIAVGILIYSGYDYLFSDRRERVAEQLDVQSTSGRIASNSIALTQSVANTMTFGYFDATMQPGGEGTVEYAKERLGLNDLSNAYQAATDSKLAPDEKVVLTTLYGLKAAGELANTGLMLTAAKGQFSSGSASLKNNQAAMEQAAVRGEAATISQREAMLVEEQLGAAAEGRTQEARLTIENAAGKPQTTVRPVEGAQPGGSKPFEKPIDPYSSDWNEWYRQNPDHPEARFRSVGAAGATKGLSNAEVRAWYNEQVKALDTSGPLTEETAMRVQNARNLLKQQARDMMTDRAAAAQLAKERPLQPFEYYVEKYTKQGFEDEALWKRIIEGGTTPNAAVNQQFRIK